MNVGVCSELLGTSFSSRSLFVRSFCRKVTLTKHIEKQHTGFPTDTDDSLAGQIGANVDCGDPTLPTMTEREIGLGKSSNNIEIDASRNGVQRSALKRQEARYFVSNATAAVSGSRMAFADSSLGNAGHRHPSEYPLRHGSPQLPLSRFNPLESSQALNYVSVSILRKDAGLCPETFSHSLALPGSCFIRVSPCKPLGSLGLLRFAMLTPYRQRSRSQVIAG